MDVLTDDHEREQVVRAWWHEYWKPITFGVVIAIAGLLGYRQWQSYQLEQAQQQAYTLYQIQTKLQMKNDNAVADAEKFIAEHEDLYGSLLSLDLATKSATEGKYDEALKHIDFARQHGGELVVPVAQLSEAKVKAQNKDFEGALKSLSAIKDEAYLIERSETEGDILLAKGDRQGAHDAYKKALDISVERKVPINALLQMKFDNVIKAGDEPAYMIADKNNTEIAKRRGEVR
ncbi:MAG: tetratricopeptide repeat protein [Succinivibrio sp.]|nr:tetratricopeptide repeat protein [Succinivibrio sp.]